MTGLSYCNDRVVNCIFEEHFCKFSDWIMPTFEVVPKSVRAIIPALLIFQSGDKDLPSEPEITLLQYNRPRLSPPIGVNAALRTRRSIDFSEHLKNFLRFL